jgi:hypothetical protein
MTLENNFQKKIENIQSKTFVYEDKNGARSNLSFEQLDVQPQNPEDPHVLLFDVVHDRLDGPMGRVYVRLDSSKQQAIIFRSDIFNTFQTSNLKESVLLPVKVFNKLRNGLNMLLKKNYAPNTGKGLGKETYKKVHNWLLENKNMILVSDIARSPESERLWASLTKNGFAEFVSKKDGDNDVSYYKFIGEKDNEN